MIDTANIVPPYELAQTIPSPASGETARKSWIDMRPPGFLDSHESAIRHGVQNVGFDYVPATEGKPATLTMPVTVGFYVNARPESNEQFWDFALIACAAMDQVDGKVGSWGPDCFVSSVVKWPLGKTVSSFADDGGRKVPGFLYTPKKLGHDEFRFVLGNGDGRELNVILKLNVVRQASDTGSLGKSGNDAHRFAEVLRASSTHVAGYFKRGDFLLESTSLDGDRIHIGLSPTATGHGRYLDRTPLDKAENFLPTADSTIWRAKAGSAADGKMDILSVSLDQYGRARGLEHNPDGSSESMAAPMRPAERRLPTADKLAWTVPQVAELKTKQGATASAQTSEGSGGSSTSPANSAQLQPAYPAWGTLGTATRRLRRSPFGRAGGAATLRNESQALP